MFKAIIYIFITLFSMSHSNAEVVKELKVSGNERVSAETIEVYGEIKIGKDYSNADVNKVIKNLYSTNFFEDIKIDLQNNTIFINVVEYPVINQLILVGEKRERFKEQIKKVIKLKEKKSFIRSYLSDDIEIIKKFYSAAGFNNSKIKIKIKEIDKKNLDLVIDIEKGGLTNISTISFTGNKKIRDKRLRDIIASEEDKFWKVISRNTKFSENLINLDKRLLTNYYKSLGFYDVEISSNTANINKEGNVDLIYSIEAGKRYLINKITTNVDPVFDSKLFFSLNSSYQKYIGDYYSPFTITNLLKDIDRLIDDNSLQFVEHNVEEILDKENGEIAIKFNIYEADKVLTERINILGNTITNENVIRGELLIDEGDPFTQLNLDKSISNLKARNIFGAVTSITKEGSSDNLKIIDIEVEEKPTGEIGAGAGIGTSGGTFSVNVAENNWLGEGKQIDFGIEVSSESLSGQISYSDPNYNFLGNSLSMFLRSTSNDKPDQGYENSTVTSGINTSFEQYKNLFATLGLQASYDDLRTDSTSSAALKKQEGEFTELAALYGFKYDKRDRSFMPTSGSVLSFNQSLPLYADKKFIANTFSLSNYKSFSESIIGSSKVYLASINGLGDDDVRLSKRKFLSNSRLRGFEKGKVGPVDGDDHIGGNYAAAINFEANLPNLLPESTKTEIGTFLDFGNLWGVDYDGSIDDSSKIRSSAGVAASWTSPIGPMTFIISQNLSKANTDKTESFSFNLGTTF